jgi:hypothetical protein
MKCLWRICREINVFSRFEYHMFYVLYPFVIYLLTLPRVSDGHLDALLYNVECKNSRLMINWKGFVRST